MSIVCVGASSVKGIGFAVGCSLVEGYCFHTFRHELQVGNGVAVDSGRRSCIVFRGVCRYVDVVRIETDVKRCQTQVGKLGNVGQ